MGNTNDDIFEDIFDEASAVSEVDEGTTSTLSSLVRQLNQAEIDIADAEIVLKSCKATRHKLATDSIPQLMDQMGVERLDVDGMKVTKKMLVSASIPVSRREEAFGWLRGAGLDDIIKNDVSVSFGKGQDNLASEIAAVLTEKYGLDTKVKTAVHPMTLKAFVRERVESGKEIDLDLFGAFITTAAEIRRK